MSTEVEQDELRSKIVEAMALASDLPHVKEALQGALTFYEAAKDRAAAANPQQET